MNLPHVLINTGQHAGNMYKTPPFPIVTLVDPCSAIGQSAGH